MGVPCQALRGALAPGLCRGSWAVPRLGEQVCRPVLPLLVPSHYRSEPVPCARDRCSSSQQPSQRFSASGHTGGVTTGPRRNNDQPGSTCTSPPGLRSRKGYLTQFPATLETASLPRSSPSSPQHSSAILFHGPLSLPAVDGRWSPWSPWSACTVTCAGGIRERTHVCNSPEPQYGGKACTGDVTEHQMCNRRGCPLGGCAGSTCRCLGLQSGWRGRDRWLSVRIENTKYTENTEKKSQFWAHRIPAFNIRAVFCQRFHVKTVPCGTLDVTAVVTETGPLLRFRYLAACCRGWQL